MKRRLSAANTSLGAIFLESGNTLGVCGVSWNWVGSQGVALRLDCGLPLVAILVTVRVYGLSPLRKWRHVATLSVLPTPRSRAGSGLRRSQNLTAAVQTQTTVAQSVTPVRWPITCYSKAASRLFTYTTCCRTCPDGENGHEDANDAGDHEGDDDDDDDDSGGELTRVIISRIKTKTVVTALQALSIRTSLKKKAKAPSSCRRKVLVIMMRVLTMMDDDDDEHDGS